MSRIILFCLLLTGSSALMLNAQKGAIVGTVVDDSGEPLISATVQVVEIGTGEITDFDGKYQLQLDPGTYSLLFTYVGYSEQRVEGIEVKANETTVQDAVLTDGAVEIEEIVVTAKAIDRSINAVFIQRKKAEQVQEIISLQEMQQLGASSAASAMTKVTGTTIVDGQYVYVRGLGDRYSYTALNGLRLPSLDPYRNSAQLDLVPTNLLDNIVASKTFTPDLPGDFTGGSVDINTKTLPERFTFSASLSLGHNTQSTFQDNFLTHDAGNTAWLGYNDGTLDLPDVLNQPGFRSQSVLSRVGASNARRNAALADSIDRVANAMNPNFEPIQKTSGPEFGISASLGNQFKLGEEMKLGLMATINYDREYSFYNNGLRANYVNRGGSSNELLENFFLSDTRSVETPQLGGMLGLSLIVSPKHTINFMSLYSHSTDIEARYLLGTYFDYDILAPEQFISRTLGFQERELIDYILSGEHVFGENGIRLDWSASLINSQQKEPDLRYFATNFDPERGSYNIALSNYSAPGHFFRTLDDEQLQAKLDITIPILQTRSKANKIKFGGYYTTKDRNFDESIFSMLRRQGNLYMGDDVAYFGPENAGLLKEDNGINTIGVYVDEETRPRNSYTGETGVKAGYGMLTFEITPRLKFIGGARIETTEIFVESDANKLSPEDSLFTDIDEVDVLPSVNLVYAINENANLRATYSNTLARPNMREVAPFGNFGFIGDPLLFGNKDLVRTRISNFDLRLELFPRSGEVLSISGFFKSFDDPIVQSFRPAGNPQFTWKNVDEAHLFGGELEWRKQLDFLSEKLSNFTLSGNFAYIFSESDIDPVELELIRAVNPDAEATRPFAGQSKYVLNTNLTYADLDTGWEAVVAYNYFGDRLEQTGVEGTPDVYERGRGLLDLSVRKQLGRVGIRLAARNLLNPDYERFASFLGQDYIYSSYKRGTDFSLSLSYKI